MPPETLLELDLRLEQNLDVVLAQRPLDGGSQSPAVVLARLVIAEHDRLCGRETAQFCAARASCRQAAGVLHLADLRAYSEYDEPYY